MPKIITFTDTLISEEYYPKGTVLEVPRADGTIRHMGIASGDGNVVHCAKRRGPVCETVAKFAKGAKIKRNTTLVGEVSPEAYDNALSRVGKGSYNVFSHNCEHFVSWAHGKKKESKQLQKFCGMAGGIAVATRIPAAGPVGWGVAAGAAVTPEDENPVPYMVAGAIASVIIKKLFK